VSGIPHLLDGLEPAIGSYRPQVLSSMWASVPADMQLQEYTPATVPPRYRGALHPLGGHRVGLDLSSLPEPMRRELSWCIFRIAEAGGVLEVQDMRLLVRSLGDTIDDLGPDAPGSLTDLPPRHWQQQVALSVQRRTGVLPDTRTSRIVRNDLLRCYRQLWTAYDPRPWWQHEVWDPTLDARIPQRLHEPLGRRSVNFLRIRTGWLRAGLQWYDKVALDTGLLCWSTIATRLTGLAVFDAFLIEHQIGVPWLVDDPARVRALMLDYLGHVKALRVAAGPNRGRPLSPSCATNQLVAVEQFYAFMTDHCDTAAAALREPGWLRLGPAHTRFYRHGEKPRQRRGRPLAPMVIEDDAFSEIMAGIGQLGDPVTEGGLGEEQAMRILMLLARTGRRVNELLMLDRDPLLPLDTPLLPLDTPLVRSGPPDAFVARLHYQQTKIEDGPDTIPVDEEIVAIIHAQQLWADKFLTDHGSPAATPKYLFLATRMNRNGDRPYPTGHLHNALTKLVARLDIHDSTGRLVDFQRTHRFRHTLATSLLNAGVPLHVVQRYLGHVSPTMTMIYAQTLEATHEREFLRYHKLTADARELGLDPRDVYDMLQLDKRTDRILPNGWCLLPPRSTCGKGNACLTCDKYVTDATCLPELSRQQAATERLIDQRCQEFRTRTGHDLDPNNIWLTARRQEHDALTRIISALHHVPTGVGGPNAIRAAGTAARTDSLTDRP
jgi:integrase